MMSTDNLLFQQALNAQLPTTTCLEVLEAGCGSTSHIKLGPTVRLTGIDISASQLERNPALSERILGDLETYPLPPQKFDVIVCWDVLEHLPNPQLAMANMHQALKPGGVMVLAFPNLWSVKGIVTKFTPFRVHAWFYRVIMGDRSNVREFKQFETYFRSVIAPARLASDARNAGLQIAYLRRYEGPVQKDMRHRYAVANWAFALVGFASRVLSFGRTNWAHSDVHVLLTKPTN